MLLISVHVKPPLTDDCHLTTIPVWPVSKTVPALTPEQAKRLVDELVVPPTDTALTVIDPVALACEQLPVVCTEYVNTPEALGMPEIVTIPPLTAPTTPAGKPANVALVAPPPNV